MFATYSCDRKCCVDYKCTQKTKQQENKAHN